MTKAKTKSICPGCLRDDETIMKEGCGSQRCPPSEEMSAYRVKKLKAESKKLDRLIKQGFSEKVYYETRAWEPKYAFQIAARMIYLNKTGYNGLYRVNKSDENLAKCMDEKTITNMVNIGDIVENPFSMFQMKNIKADLNLFGEFAEVAGDLSACHFEASGKDIWDMCT